MFIWLHGGASRSSTVSHQLSDVVLAGVIVGSRSGGDVAAGASAGWRVIGQGGMLLEKLKQGREVALFRTLL